MAKSKTPQSAFPDRDGRVEDLWTYMAKTQDLATVIACCAHGADEMNDKSKYLGAMRSAAEIVGDRIGNAIGELENIWKATDDQIKPNRKRTA